MHRQNSNWNLEFNGQSSFKYLEVAKHERKHNHSHNELELLLITRGQGVRIIGDSVEKFERGDLCLVGSKLTHTWYSEKESEEPILALVIQFDPDTFGSSFLSLPEFLPIQNLLIKAEKGFHFTGPTRDKIEDQMLEIGNYHPSSPQRICLLMNILATMTHSKDIHILNESNYSFYPEGKVDGNLEKIHLMTQKHLNNPMGQAWIAKEMHMSPAAFSRYFKRIMGKTYTDHINQLRVNSACRYLLESEEDISFIALDSGFSNLSHFNNMFKRVKGMTPSQYRKLFVSSGATL